jgi:tRNA A37 N6-isopentenylltransferase MiaA
MTNDQLSMANKCSSFNNQLFKIEIDNLDIEKLNENWKLIFENSSIFDLMSQKLKCRIHQFARRQLTWFRRFPEINWLSNYTEIKRFTKIFLEH